MAPAVGFEKGGRQCGEHTVAGQAEDEIRVRVIERQLHQFGVGEMAVAAQHDVGLGPGGTQTLENPLEDHGVLRPLWALAGTEGGGDEFAGDPLEQEQRQVAVAAVVVVVEAQLLRSVGGVLGMIHVQDDELGWFGIAGDELIDEGLGQAVDVFGRGAILQARERGGAGQVGIGIQRLAIKAQLEERIASERIGVIAVLVGAGDLIGTLSKQLPQVVGDIGRMALVVEGLRQMRGQADVAVYTAQDHGAEIRRQGATIEIASDRQAVDGGKSQLLWDRLGHGRPRLAPSGAFLAKHQLYQLVRRGSPFFMNNSG